MREGYVLSDLTAKLALTSDQQKSVGSILANARSQAKDLRGDQSLSPQDRHAKMREILASTHDQVRSALTADQQKLFDALPANAKRPPAPAPDTVQPPPADPAAQTPPPPASN